MRSACPSSNGPTCRTNWGLVTVFSSVSDGSRMSSVDVSPWTNERNRGAPRGILRAVTLLWALDASGAISTTTRTPADSSSNPGDVHCMRCFTLHASWMLLIMSRLNFARSSSVQLKSASWARVNRWVL